MDQLVLLMISRSPCQRGLACNERLNGYIEKPGSSQGWKVANVGKPELPEAILVARSGYGSE